jgi:ssDNA-binding replication factor A large subunit
VQADDLSHNPITPVNALNLYQNRWTIKVRVTSKGDIKRYSNDRTKDGKLFHFDVVDNEVLPPPALKARVFFKINYENRKEKLG